MNEHLAIEVLQNSINSLIKNQQQNKYGFIDPSEVSGDIIANGALAIIRERNQRIAEKNSNDDYEGIDPRETFRNNLTTWMRSRDSISEDKGYRNIANSFKLACLKVVDGLSIDDANYVEEEIFSLAQDGNVEEVLTNYFLARHGIDPFYQH